MAKNKTIDKDKIHPKSRGIMSAKDFVEAVNVWWNTGNEAKAVRVSNTSYPVFHKYLQKFVNGEHISPYVWKENLDKTEGLIEVEMPQASKKKIENLLKGVRDENNKGVRKES